MQEDCQSPRTLACPSKKTKSRRKAMETPGTKACLPSCCPWRALLRNPGASNKARTVRRLLQIPPQPGTWLQGSLRPEGHCGCPDFSFLSHGEPEDKIVKVLVLLSNLRRILNLGDKKSSGSQALLAGKMNRICLCLWEMRRNTGRDYWLSKGHLYPLPFLSPYQAGLVLPGASY